MQTYSGTIIEGSKKARGLGFPTVNIACVDKTISGIYAGEVEIKGKKYHAAIFADAKRKLLEAYLLDFSGDLYGERVAFTLLEKIRERRDFTDTESLKQAIANDAAKTRAYFKNQKDARYV